MNQRTIVDDNLNLSYVWKSPDKIWFDDIGARDQETKERSNRRVFKICNGYYNIARYISRTKGHKAALVKEK